MHVHGPCQYSTYIILLLVRIDSRKAPLAIYRATHQVGVTVPHWLDRVNYRETCTPAAATPTRMYKTKNTAWIKHGQILSNGRIFPKHSCGVCKLCSNNYASHLVTVYITMSSTARTGYRTGDTHDSDDGDFLVTRFQTFLGAQSNVRNSKATSFGTKK